MKVKIGQEQEEVLETETLPGDDGSEEQAAEEAAKAAGEAEKERVRALEIENARLKGHNDALATKTTPTPNQNDAWKAQVWNDANGLSEEDFQAKYKVPKHQATAALLDQDFKAADARNKQQIAELRAENQLFSRYGQSEVDKHRNEIEQAVADAAFEVKQDPARLTRVMERALLAAMKDEKPEKTPKKGEPVKRIVNDFEKPESVSAPGKAKDSKKDEIPEEFRGLARVFGIESEAERRELLSSNYVPMNLGAGKVFRDPAKGVELVKE